MTLDLFPDAEPSITLDFLKSKKLDPRIAFSRASAASPDSSAMVNGKVQQFGIDVPRLSGQGLLIEESRTNLLLQSTDFTTYWTKYNVTIDPNVETAPDGATTASKMQWSSSSNRNCVYASPTADVTKTHTCSFYAKADEWNFAAVALQPPGGGQPRYWITVDLTTGDVEEYSSSSPTQTDYDVTPLPNGWWRVSATANVNSAGKTQIQMEVGMSPNNTYGNVVSGTPDNSGIYIWGAQAEQGAFPSSLIPTSGSAATRAADLALLSNADVTSWYNITEGTVCSEAMSPIDLTTSRLVWHFRDPGRKEHNADNGFQWYDVGTGYSTNGYTYAAGVFNKQAYAFSSVVGSSTRACLNGAFRYDKPVDPNITPSAHKTLVLGSNVGVNLFLNGYIQRFSYYPTRVSDDALEALTS